MKFFPIAALGLAAALAATPVLAAWKLGGIEVSQARTRPAAAGMTGVGYLAVTNRGKAPDTLLSATSPLATSVELHQSSMTGGVMRMRPVTSGIALAPGQTVTLAPGGYHLMLKGLKRAIGPGERAPVTLVFKSAGKMQVELLADGAPAKDDGMAGMHMGH